MKYSIKLKMMTGFFILLLSVGSLFAQCCDNIIATVGNGQIFSSEDQGITWTSRFKDATLSLGPSVVHNDSGYLISSASIVLKSNNGIDWTKSPVFFRESPKALLWDKNKGQYILADGLTIYTSTDGINWISRFRGSGYTGYHAIAYGNGRYIATGGLIDSSSATSYRAMSLDSMIWKAVPNDTSVVVWKVRFLNNQFVAIGQKGGYDDPNQEAGIYTSSDGSEWTWHSTDPKGIWFSDLTYGKDTHGEDVYVLVGQEKVGNDYKGVIYISRDAESWKKVRVNVPVSTLWTVSFVKDKFFIGGDAGLIMTSSDGLEWTVQDKTGITGPIIGIG